jgi:large subunit ribosomal protein L20
MPRVRKGSARKRAHKRVLREARGYYGTKSRHFQQAKIAITRAGKFAYRDRRTRKRDMRKLWIIRINAACRMRGMRYSLFINGLRHAGIVLNRKMLSQIAIEDPATFDTIVERAKEAATASPAKERLSPAIAG